uniref:Uncharacterized protein n=1 Tax=Pristionchus pacificus TaxID=54126 RepID=A0A8R1U653_PRIPA
MRAPLIKFVGARLPRPNFAAVAAQPVQQQLQPAAAPRAAAAPTTTTGLKKKSGPVIDESQLPMRFRRPVIDAYEVAAINNGGSYGLVLEEPKKAGAGKK